MKNTRSKVNTKTKTRGVGPKGKDQEFKEAGTRPRNFLIKDNDKATHKLEYESTVILKMCFS